MAGFSRQKKVQHTEQLKQTEKKWNQWLAGLIDGDGYLGITLDGYAVLEITMGLADEFALAQIKQKLGGSLKLRSGAKAVRYRLKARDQVVKCIHLINGEIRNTIRVAQLQKVCNHLNIPYKTAVVLTANNGYTAGFFDADGSISISVNKTSAELSTISGIEGKIQRLSNARGFHQLTLKITNKYECNVAIFQKAFGFGTIICDDSRDTGPIFHWYFRDRAEISQFLGYTKTYPLRSDKKKKLFLVDSFFDLKSQKAHLSTKNSVLGKAWVAFCRKWF